MNIQELPTQNELQAMTEEEQNVQKELIAEELAKILGLNIKEQGLDQLDFIEMHKGILKRVILKVFLLGTEVGEKRSK